MIKPAFFEAIGSLQHLISTEDLSKEAVYAILDTAKQFISKENRIKKHPLLKGKSVFNLFFENSTRTRTTFEIAAKSLSADVINLNIATSATSKGESLLDTIDNLAAMHADMFMIRHPASGAPYLIAQHLKKSRFEHVNIINAGDGQHAHPTQALLDAFTIQHYKKSFERLSIAIIGDIKHSRVVRSQINLFQTLGVGDIRVIAPQTLLPTHIESLGVQAYSNTNEGVRDADVIITLRLQNERMEAALLPSEKEFFNMYGLTDQRLKLAHPNAIVMHPGPMNRGIEIASGVSDGSQSVILPQVTFGIAVRMAVMSLLSGTTT